MRSSTAIPSRCVNTASRCDFDKHSVFELDPEGNRPLRRALGDANVVAIGERAKHEDTRCVPVRLLIISS
jgi:hypothetical protein